MTSSLSLVSKNVEERAPRSIHDSLCQGMILDHVENTQLLHSDDLIVFGILLCRLIVEITTLAFDLEVDLCRAPSSVTTTIAALVAPRDHALLASQRRGARAIEARVLHRVAQAISQERLQPHVNADGR